MTRAQAPLWRPILLLALAILLLFGAGALSARYRFLARGTIEGLPAPISHGGVDVGVNVALDPADDDALRAALTEIAASGVRHVKQTFYYDPQYDWEESQRLVSAVAAHDLRLSVLLDGNPQNHFAPPENLQAFASWAGEFARRYGNTIRYYFVWDEPNLASHWGLGPVNPSEYGALLSATAEAIRSADNDAVIVMAPLAPTTEVGSENLADNIYLSELYAVGAGDVFDVVAAKPYGFHSGPYDRTVDLHTLNFSRAILLRDVMLEHGDGDKAIFAGNWGWNALPANWAGGPSIWGHTEQETRVDYTEQALERARREWPWMGLMFLEIWQSPRPADDPHHGFDIADTPLEQALPNLVIPENVAFPGFHLASAKNPAQEFEGDWRFSPEYGADISQTGDRVTVHFWGTDVGLRIRRADYRARLYVTVDGRPAPELPHDGTGAALVLTAPELDPAVDYLDTVAVARDLMPGRHTMVVEAYRGWDQWAVNGFAVGYSPPGDAAGALVIAMVAGGLFMLLSGFLDLRRAEWDKVGRSWRSRYRTLSEQAKLLLTFLAGAIVALTGWLSWGEQAAGIYRRMGDTGQLALTAAAASAFYVAPSFLVYVPALLMLFFLIYARPAWGLALVALSFPFYVLPKPMAGYRFSPVEIFVLLTAGAAALSYAGRVRQSFKDSGNAKYGGTGRLAQHWHAIHRRLVSADYAVAFLVLIATVSLLFTERLDVAVNEWRVVIVEPALFYFLMRACRPSSKEMKVIIDAFVLGAVVVAVYGLWRYAFGFNVVTVAGGLARLRSVYGSPNNVALYLGRAIPFLLSIALMGHASRRRRILYALALAPVGASLLLTFSKGAFFLGLPAAIGLVILLWLRSTGRRLWPWLLATALGVAVAFIALFTIPALAARLDLQGVTSVMRLSLWRASLNMFADHPIIGVGLDNFLYAYRGRYILESGWQEPRLNHPHNIVLDFATRLGTAGLLAGGWLMIVFVRNLWRLPQRSNATWRPIAIGVAGMLAQMLAHGMVDHSFFLVDLAFVFFFNLGLVVWLQSKKTATLS